MADIDIERAHSLPMAEAQQLVDKIATEMGDKMGLECTKNGNNIAFKRSGVDGEITLDENAIRIQAELGFMMKAMKPMIVGAINKRLDEVLA